MDYSTWCSMHYVCVYEQTHDSAVMHLVSAHCSDSCSLRLHTGVWVRECGRRGGTDRATSRMHGTALTHTHADNHIGKFKSSLLMSFGRCSVRTACDWAHTAPLAWAHHGFGQLGRQACKALGPLFESPDCFEAPIKLTAVYKCTKLLCILFVLYLTLPVMPAATRLKSWCCRQTCPHASYSAPVSHAFGLYCSCGSQLPIARVDFTIHPHIGSLSRFRPRRFALVALF